MSPAAALEAWPHTFHIPVMGTGFTLDTPLKVARFGISSVVSLVDDEIIERMRRYYCHLYGLDYLAVPVGSEDSRARRITLYLNLLHDQVADQMRELAAAPFVPGGDLARYFELLPEASPLRAAYKEMIAIRDPEERTRREPELRRRLRPGNIDVNIMTKLDRQRWRGDQELPPGQSDAVAALRGFALSKLRSSIVFSAGLNGRLFDSMESCSDFFPAADGTLGKRITLKVSDYRSAYVQGRMLARKGLWVSEYRIESGLNCGGHAFATEGLLLGPVLDEFQHRREELGGELRSLLLTALRARGLPEPPALPLRLTVQGGVATAGEHRFLLERYNVDAVGWGTPFLLVPEATSVDDETLVRLIAAREEDVYLSRASPLGVPFYNLRNSLSEEERRRRISEGNPGSECPRGHLASNTEFSKKPLCLASRAYQRLKLAELAAAGLDPEVRSRAEERVLEKSCICRDLGGGALIKHGIARRGEAHSAVCPGPNIAFFHKLASLKEMVDHIYGRGDLLGAVHRPHMFLQEFGIYIDFWKNLAQEAAAAGEREKGRLRQFYENLLKGARGYEATMKDWSLETADFLERMRAELQRLLNLLEEAGRQVPWMNPQPSPAGA